jgi:LL-diaminopimelate aminotransferase
MNDFKGSVARWYRRRFGVELDADSEVLTLIGSKEGIAHLPLAFINPGDLALVPSPAYPVYYITTMFAGGESYFMPLRRENGFLPDLEAIPADVARRAKMIFINYPNNPTGATAEREFFLGVIDFAREYGLVVCHDAAYTEMAFDGYRPMSFMEVPGAKEIGIEFHSLSKTYNMTGWRLRGRERPDDRRPDRSKQHRLEPSAVHLLDSCLEGNQSCVAEMQPSTRKGGTLSYAAQKIY